MAVLVGGKRDRMIAESVLQSAKAYLTSLGWFNTGRQHLPITVVDEYPDDNSTVDVALNTLAFSMATSTGNHAELGSKTEIRYVTFFFDFFAENDALGKHLIGDIYEWVMSNETLPVFDYDDVGDPQEFVVEVEDDAETRKPTNATNNWQKHWYICSFTVSDVRSH